MPVKQKITGKMTFADVLKKYPETAQVFLDNGMHCLGCAMSMYETIESGALAHGISIKKLMKDLNEAIK